MSTTAPPARPLSDIAKAIRKQLRDGNAERGLGLSEWDVAFLANRVLVALPRVRPADREPRSGKVPVDVYERAMLAAASAAAEKGSVCPVAAPNPPGEPSGASGPEIGPQRPAGDPIALDVLRLLVAGLTNPQIAAQLGLTNPQVRYRVRWWMRTSDRHTRLELGVWAHQTGVLDGPEAQR